MNFCSIALLPQSDPQKRISNWKTFLGSKRLDRRQVIKITTAKAVVIFYCLLTMKQSYFYIIRFVDTYF